ncbi:Nuclear pore complex protein Nup98-Nup96 [Orchesella cincta]|uniref:Nuclear pore complex protein Nup98-Nup96 n=1 Tax=Orchesella cincta TaxID=48709 RepID=A0A1D2MGC7_ORCCI|nr:Nuclear pore complex protein Nup98-Nup96 [Orchesella cincta]
MFGNNSSTSEGSLQTLDPPMDCFQLSRSKRPRLFLEPELQAIPLGDGFNSSRQHLGLLEVLQLLLKVFLDNRQEAVDFGGASTAGGGIFGGASSSTASSGAFSSPNTAGSSIPFVASEIKEIVPRSNGTMTTIDYRIQSISTMKQYKDKSFEELRLEDYQLNRKGPQRALFGNASSQPNSSGTLGVFGQFGQTATPSSNSFGAGLGQTKTGGIFGSGTGVAPAASGFGTGATASTGFGFQVIPQAQQSIFGSSTTTTTPFLSQQQQPQQQNLWNQNTATTSAAPAFGTSLFGGTATASTTNITPVFGAGTSLFGQQQQAKPTGFSSLFSNNTTASTQPQSFFGGFAANPQASSTTAPTIFGAGTGTTFGAATSTSTYNFGNVNQTIGSTPSIQFGFKPSGITSNVNANATNIVNAPLSLFNTSGNASGLGLPLQQQQQQSYQYYPPRVIIPFATTPYKDNSLFYNMISDRKLENMTKPTNPLAIRQYMNFHRQARSIAAESSANLSWKGANNISPPQRNRHVSIDKFVIWDDNYATDFDEGYGVNILVPKIKKDWKRLSLDSASTTQTGNAEKSRRMLSRSLNLSDSALRWMKSDPITEGPAKSRTRRSFNKIGGGHINNIHFRHKEVVVYPDDKNKPPLYEGLNVPAEVELERVCPIDKVTNEPILCLKNIEEIKYEEKLKKACKRLEAEFISYNRTDYIWKFRVAHFSKYSCEVEEDDEEEGNGTANGNGTQPATIAAPKRFDVSFPGLGGIPLSDQQKQLAAIAKHIVGPGGDATASSSAAAPSEVIPNLVQSDSKLKDSGLENRSLLKGVTLHEESNLMQRYLPTPPKKSKAPESNLSLASFSTTSQSEHQKPVACSTEIWPELEQSSISSNPQAPRHVQRYIFPQEQIEEQVELLQIPQAPPEQIIIHSVQPVEFLSVKEQELNEDHFASLKISGVKLQGCPRVCFLPSGHFLSINQTTSFSQSFQMKLCQFSSYADKQETAILSEAIRAVLQNQLESRLTNRQGVLFQEHIQILQAQIKQSNFPQIRAGLEQERALWQLCNILWPEQETSDEILLDDGFQLTQRANLSNWLRENAHILFGNLYNSEDSSVFGLLKKGLVEQACEEAINQESFVLATLLVSDPHLLLQFDDCPGIVKEGMPETTSDIFLLVSGCLAGLSELTSEKVMNMSTHEWFQYFALFVWYNGPTKSCVATTVDKAIREYEEMMRSIIGVEADQETVALPSNETCTIANLCMHLLKMYSCTGYPMHLVVSPGIWTSNLLDYKLVWLLMRDLEEIGYQVGDQTYSEVCLSFAGELESIGLWKWAVFVLKNIELNEEDDEDGGSKVFGQRDAFFLRLLERNVADGEEDLEAERFLVYRLGVDEKLLCFVKSWKCSKSHEKIWYLGKMGEWQESLTTFISYLTEGNNILALVAEQNPAVGYSKNVMGYLETFGQNCKSLDDWDKFGVMLYNYLKLKTIQNQCGVERDGDGKGLYDMGPTVSCFLESVIKFQPFKPSQHALLLEMALNAQKVVQLMLVSSKVENAEKAKLYGDLQEFFDIPIPNEYFVGLMSFINRNFSDLNAIYMGETF